MTGHVAAHHDDAGSVTWPEAEVRGQHDAFISRAMQWHFSPETGSRFWLDRLPSLAFDPCKEVTCHADLRKFPTDIAAQLRDVPITDLVPRGADPRQIVGAFESGGTTGTPKSVLLDTEWLAASLGWVSDRMDALAFPPAGCWLLAAPTGPHIFGRLMQELVRLRGGICFSVDLDPRWVRYMLAVGYEQEVSRYTEHILNQIRAVLRQQPIDVLVITPSLLELAATDDELVNLITRKVRSVLWGGTHMDPDNRRLLRGEVFPGVGIHGMYGSTTIRGGSMERAEPDDQHCIFDPFAPYTTFDVVHPDTGADVGVGGRGQVVMHHVTKWLLLPNNRERDIATSVAAPPGVAGVSVADVAPAPTFSGASVIEGVY